VSAFALGCINCNNRRCQRLIQQNTGGNQRRKKRYRVGEASRVECTYAASLHVDEGELSLRAGGARKKDGLYRKEKSGSLVDCSTPNWLGVGGPQPC